jgi:coenzyme F420 hydrogenase subunit delta
MLYPEIVVVGCGNPLFGDDGFGPAVIEELQKLQLPDHVKMIDAGLGAPHFIFTLLDVETTRKLVIIDIADFGAEPGNVTILPVEALPPGSYRDVHSWDLTEPLHRLKDKIDITVIACQPKSVAEFKMELTEEVKRAIPKAVRIVLKEIGVPYGTAINLQEEGGRGAEARGGAEEGAGTGKTCGDVL